MKLTLFQLSSYYLIFLIPPIFYRVQFIRNSLIRPSSIFYSNYFSKNIILYLLLSINAAMLVLRSSQETTKMIDPVYFLLQIVIITHLLLENYTENKLGMGSPWYTFGLYFAANLVFLLFCHGFYAAAGEHCEGYNCGDGKTCKACRVFPMLANELTVDDGVECLEYAAGGVTKVAMWIFIEAEVVFSVIGLVLEGLAKKKFRDNAMLVNNTSTDQLELM